MSRRLFYSCIAASLFFVLSSAWAAMGPIIEPPGLFHAFDTFPAAMRAAVAISATVVAAGLFLFGLPFLAALSVFQTVIRVRFQAFVRQITVAMGSTWPSSFLDSRVILN